MQAKLEAAVTDITRTENGPRQFCRGGLESGCSHEARTYTTVHYGNRRFHFCDAHPHEVTPELEPAWLEDEASLAEIRAHTR